MCAACLALSATVPAASASLCPTTGACSRARSAALCAVSWTVGVFLFRSVVRRICAVLDELVPEGAPREGLIAFVADRPGHDARYAIDAGKLESELGWRAQEDFDSGIAKTVRWYLDNEWWWRPLRERYDGERLGLDATGGA